MLLALFFAEPGAELRQGRHAVRKAGSLECLHLLLILANYLEKHSIEASRRTLNNAEISSLVLIVSSL